MPSPTKIPSGSLCKPSRPILPIPSLPAQTQPGSCSPLRGRKVLKAKPERKAPKAFRDRWVFRVRKDCKDPQDPQGHKDPPALPEPQATPVPPDRQEPKDQRDRPVESP